MLGGDLRWDLIGYGALIGAAIIAADEILGRMGKLRLPPLGVGMGIYLPMSLTLLIPIGAVIGHFWEKRAERSARPEFYSRMGVLLATGFIVGESIFGVLFAGVVAGSGSDAPLVLVGESFERTAIIVGLSLFVALIAYSYRRTRRATESV